MGSNTGSYSRNMFSEEKLYVQRRVTQGIPWVDADENDLEQGNFRQHRRIEEILGDGAVGDGFKCVGVGLNNDFNVLGGDGTDDGAGRFFLHGHDCMLKAATTFKNNGSTEGGRSLNPRITYIQFLSGPSQTQISDSASNWAANEHAGKIITPDITQPGSTFTIIGNTTHMLTVSGDATAVAQVGDNYRIEMSTPVGSDRTDGVFLNVYLDEFDCVDDPNLIHNLNTSTCAQLRMKLIQTVYIQQGAETFSDYVDGDGNQHYVFEIARIHRYDGVDAIWDIDDLRPILSDGHGIYPELMLNNNNLRVIASSPLANTVAVMPGWWTLSDRSALKKFPTVTNSPVFTPVTLAGRTRYDMLMIDDGGTLIVKPGVEFAGAGDPFGNAPAPDMDKLCLGIIRVTETAGVIIDKEDITDAREFLNIGMAANALASFYAALWLRPHSQVVPDNTVRIEAGRYIKSDGTLAVDKPAAFNSPIFAPAGVGQERYDLLVIDDSGTAQIITGTPVPTGTGTFLGNCPPFEFDKLTIAVVKVEEAGTAVIHSGDVLDVREFLNKGGGSLAIQDEAFPIGRANTINFAGPGVSASILGGVATVTIPGGGGGGTCPGPTMYQVMTATQGQTVFNLSSAYTMGTNALWVFRNGARQIHSSDYTEVTPTQIVFNYPLNASEQVVFVQMGSTAGNMAVSSRQEAIATAGQTVFNLSFSFTPGSNELFVWSGGILQWVGASNDYTETSTNQITFNVGRSVGERVIVARIGSSGASAMKLWEKQVATGGQTVFNLTGSYAVGSHSLQVFQEGALLTVGDDYVETGSSTVTLNVGATASDTLIFMVAGGDVVACVDGGMLQYEKQTAILGQTVFNLGFNYTPGLLGLMVTRNGQVLRPGVDYTETSISIVTFTTGCFAGDEIEFRNFCRTGGLDEGILLWYKFASVAIGQTLFTLPFHYARGTHHLVVVRNGAYQVVDMDYTETAQDQITFTTPIVALTEEIVVYTIAHAKTIGAHTLPFHPDWPDPAGHAAEGLITNGSTYRWSYLDRMNVLTNGGFEIWQRGAGPFTGTPGTYAFTADEWKYAFGTGQSGTVSQEISTIYSGEKGLKLQITGGTGGRVQQGIESYKSLSGMTLTFSVWVKCSVAAAAQIQLLYNTGVQSAFSSAFHSGSGNWERLTVTGTLPTGLVTYAPWPHGFGLSADLVVLGTNTAYFDGATLVVGNFPEGVPFVPMNPAEDMLRCLRFYEVGGTGPTDGVNFNSDVTSGSSYMAWRAFTVQKYSVPTLAMNATGNTNFPAVVGTVVKTVNGFSEQRTANGTGAGYFSSDWTAEVP